MTLTSYQQAARREFFEKWDGAATEGQKVQMVESFIDTLLLNLVEELEKEITRELERCCKECFGPSYDRLVGPEYMVSEAMPEGCKEEECPCHVRSETIIKKFREYKNI